MVNANVAGGVARRIHAGQVSRSGEPLIEHVERVARAVPADVRALAYLHDVLDRADGAVDEELRELEMSDEDRRVLALLTRRPEESFRVYVMRIARADGRVGRIARTIKLADLDDHVRQRRVGARARDYAWARRQIAASQRPPLLSSVRGDASLA